MVANRGRESPSAKGDNRATQVRSCMRDVDDDVDDLNGVDDADDIHDAADVYDADADDDSIQVSDHLPGHNSLREISHESILILYTGPPYLGTWTPSQ
jgi:hypothetical protein